MIVNAAFDAGDTINFSTTVTPGLQVFTVLFLNPSGQNASYVNSGSGSLTAQAGDNFADLEVGLTAGPGVATVTATCVPAGSQSGSPQNNSSIIDQMRQTFPKVAAQ